MPAPETLGRLALAYRTRVGLLGDEIVLNSNNNNFREAAAGQPVLISLDDADTLSTNSATRSTICW
jgi:peptidyl-dipeptidase Dcp